MGGLASPPLVWLCVGRLSYCSSIRLADYGCHYVLGERRSGGCPQMPVGHRPNPSAWPRTELRFHKCHSIGEPLADTSMHRITQQIRIIRTMDDITSGKITIAMKSLDLTGLAASGGRIRPYRNTLRKRCPTAPSRPVCYLQSRWQLAHLRKAAVSGKDCRFCPLPSGARWDFASGL